MGSVSGSRVTLLALLGYHLLKALMLKRVYSADLPQYEVKLIKTTARVYRVAKKGEWGDWGRSEDDVAWEHLL